MSYTRNLTSSERVPATGFVGSTKSDYSRNFVFTGSRTGEKVDKFKEKIATGLPAASPYSLDMTKLVQGLPETHLGVMQSKFPPFEILSFGAEGHLGIYSNGGNTLNHLGANQSMARSVALSKLYKKLESDRSEMNAAASLAEITDVLRQFGAPFSSIVNAFLRHENRLIFERRRLVGSKTWKDEKFRRIAADTWLETSFGLIPLLSDAVSVAEAFGRWQYELSDSPKLRDRMRTRALDKVVQQTTPSIKWFFNVGINNRQRTTTEARAQYVVGLKGDVRADFGSNDRLLQLLGLEARNIPLAIWEATPWSWLVDYGTNVQQILQAGATITSRVNWIVLTETLRTEQEGIPGEPIFWVDPSSWKLLSNSSKYPPKGEQRVTRIIRTTLSRTLPQTLGVPPLYFKSPLGDVKKVANLLAVAVTRSKDRSTWLS